MQISLKPVVAALLFSRVDPLSQEMVLLELLSALSAPDLETWKLSKFGHGLEKMEESWTTGFTAWESDEKTFT